MYDVVALTINTNRLLCRGGAAFTASWPLHVPHPRTARRPRRAARLCGAAVTEAFVASLAPHAARRARRAVVASSMLWFRSDLLDARAAPGGEAPSAAERQRWLEALADAAAHRAEPGALLAGTLRITIVEASLPCGEQPMLRRPAPLQD